MEERLRRIARREAELREAQDAREKELRLLAAEEMQRKQAEATRKLELKYSGREERCEDCVALAPPPEVIQSGKVAHLFLSQVRQQEQKKAEAAESIANALVKARLDALYGPCAVVTVTPLAERRVPSRKPPWALQHSEDSQKTVHTTAGLPDEIWLEVLSYLGVDGLQACRGVSRHLRRLASDDALWQPMMYDLYPREAARVLDHDQSWVTRAMCCMRAGPWNRKGGRSTLALSGTLGSVPTALACLGRCVAVAMSDCSVVVMELESAQGGPVLAKQSWKLTSTGAVLCMDISPSGRLLACGLEDGHVQVADMRTQSWVALLAPHSGRVGKVVFTSEESLASCDSTRVAFSNLATLSSSSLWIVGVLGIACLEQSRLFVTTSSCCHVVSVYKAGLGTLCSWSAELEGGEAIAACCANSRVVAVVVSGSGGTRVLLYDPGALLAASRLLGSRTIAGASALLYAVELQDDVMLLVTLVGVDGVLKTARFDVSLAVVSALRWTVHCWLSDGPSLAPAATNGVVIAVDSARRLVVLRPSEHDQPTAQDGPDDQEGSSDEQQLWEAIVGKLAPLAPW